MKGFRKVIHQKGKQARPSIEYRTETSVVWSEFSGKRREVISAGFRSDGRLFGEVSKELSLDARWILQ